MRSYGKISPRFWVGNTGRELRREGPLPRLIAMYLCTAPSATMTGIYYLPIPLMAHEVGCSVRRARKALAVLVQKGFCQYDEDREIVWVVNMAREQIGEELAPKDNRVSSIRAQLDHYANTPLGQEWLHRYGAAYHCQDLLDDPIDHIRDGDEDEDPSKAAPETGKVPEPQVLRTIPDRIAALVSKGSGSPFEGVGKGSRRGREAPSKGSGSPFEAPSKPESRIRSREQREPERAHTPGGKQPSDRSHEGVSKPIGTPSEALPNPFGTPSEPRSRDQLSATPRCNVDLDEARPVPQHERLAYAKALWRYQNEVRQRVCPDVGDLPCNDLPGGPLDQVRLLLGTYSPADCKRVLDLAGIEAELRKSQGQDALKYLNGFTNWKDEPFGRLAGTTESALRARFKRRSSNNDTRCQQSDDVQAQLAALENARARGELL